MPISTQIQAPYNPHQCQILIESESTYKQPVPNNEIIDMQNNNILGHNILPKRRHSWSKRDSFEKSDSTKINPYIKSKSNHEANPELIKLESKGNCIRSFNDIVITKSPWDILCKLLNCKVAFRKNHNGRKYNWIQLAGHAGRFIPGEREGYILKLLDHSERQCLIDLQTDFLNTFVPKIDRIIFNNTDKKNYMEMQDLLYTFNNPSIMDIKIGTRTFLETDSDPKETKPRKDLYLKLYEMAPNELTEAENTLGAITKKRYMSWRERSSCSSNLGFRIEAIKKNQVSEKEFYTVKEKNQVLSHIKSYTNNNKTIQEMYLRRLLDLKGSLKKSIFFSTHEMIGSSLLFVHDNNFASIWIIDFGKTRMLPAGIEIDHLSKWVEGNHEDGYLFGINNLIEIFQEAIFS